MTTKMNTKDLIERLARDTVPVPRRSASLRLGLSLVVAMIVVLVLVAALLGFRPDLDIAMAGVMFWMKLAYTASIALIAVAALPTLVRPEARPPRWLWLLAVPVALLGLVSAHEMEAIPKDQWIAMWLGNSWRVCSAWIFTFSLPVAAALVLVVRRFAPTRLVQTGAVIGLASGAAAAAIYSLHCPEASASFVLTWYTIGILVATLAGATLGPRLLRW